LDLWAFCVSKDGGLGLDEERFWSLTPVELHALTSRYMLAHGIKPAPTVEEVARGVYLNREFNARMLRARCASEKKNQERREERRKRRGG